jgi:hypothetical protein
MTSLNPRPAKVPSREPSSVSYSSLAWFPEAAGPPRSS